MNYIPSQHQQLTPLYEADIAYTNTRFAAFLGSILALIAIPYIFASDLDQHPQQVLFVASNTLNALLFLLWLIPLLEVFPKARVQQWSGFILIAQALTTIPLGLTVANFSELLSFYGILATVSLVVYWSEKWHHITLIIVFLCLAINPFIVGVSYSAKVISYILGFGVFLIIIAAVQRPFLQYRWNQFFNRYQVEELNHILQKRTDELDAFARTVAHDLKAPLSAILGYTQLMQESLASKSLLDDDNEFFSANIEALSAKSMSLIDELLLFAATSKEDVKTAPLDMSEIVTRAIQRSELQIAEQKTVVKVPTVWPTAVGYAPWIEEVWSNYISNALKYGGNPPEVEVGANQETTGAIQFWVRDNGKGVPAEHQSLLFVEFSRLDKASHIHGHGLGLSIVRRIVEKLNGSVGMTSTEGEGCTFYFTLPSSQ